MSSTKAQIASAVANRIGDIPSALTASDNSIIQDFVEDAHLEIESITGDSFETSAVPDTIRPALIYLTLIYVINYTLTSDYTVGKISITRRLNERLRMLQDKFDRTIGNYQKTIMRTTEHDPSA